MDDLIISCKNADNQLFKVISTIQVALAVKNSAFSLSETRVDSSFLYVFENPKKNLVLYVGREVGNKKLTFIATDARRITWALLEGFSREEAFELTGVLMRLKSLEDAATYMQGLNDYRVISRFSSETVK